MKYRKQIRGNNYLYINNINNIPHKNNINSQINYNQKVSQSSNTIPKDINLNDIFIQMLNISNEFYENKSNSIYTKLTQEELHSRKIVLESIKCFIFQNKIRYKILYNIIFIFDSLLALNKINKFFISMEKLALGCTILSLKYHYEEIRVICLKNFRTIFKNKYYTIKEINEMELLCLKLLNYDLNFPSPISFMEIILLNRIISYQDDIKRDTRKRIYNLIMNSLEKILLESNEYIKYNPLYLCCSIVYYTREILGLEKWPRILSNLFKTDFQAFEMIYNEYFKINKHKENHRNSNYDSSNNISTNIDSHGNLSNSKRKEKIKDNNSNNNNFNNKERENKRQKIGIKKINISMSQGLLNNIIISEKKRKRYNISVDIAFDKREKEKEKNSYKKAIPEKYILIRNKSSLDNIFNSGKSSPHEKNSTSNLLSFNIDKLNKSKININSLNSFKDFKYNNIRTIYINNNIKNRLETKVEKEHEKEQPIKNIKVSLQPFFMPNYRQINKNLDKFITTESNNFPLFNKKITTFEESTNNDIKEKENFMPKDLNFSSNLNNLKDWSKNKYKRYSSCEIKYEDKEKIRFTNNDNNPIYEEKEEKNKNNSIRRNYYFLKNINSNINEEENEEDFMRKTFFYDNNVKKRNDINKGHASAKSIEIIPKNKIKVYNIRNSKNDNIYEKEKEEQNDEYFGGFLKNYRKSVNKKTLRLNSLGRFYEYQKSPEVSEEKKYNFIENKSSHIRNFYKKKNADNRILNKN